jgi:hypothetical protein
MKERAAMQSAFRNGIAALTISLLPVVGSQAQQPVPAECAQNAPVCALKGGDRQTYWNACLALRDGAQFLYAGNCRISRSYG